MTFKKPMLTLLLLAAAGGALAPSVGAQESTVPVFRVTVVAHTTSAVNYRPRRGDTKVDFAGTVLSPNAKGSAKVSGEQGYMKIEARFDAMAPASRFGNEYLTYVLWAITPEGRASNLGEVQVDGDDAKVEVTTELQAFGLIVTAEPYFAVTQPSDVVVLENVVRDTTNGKVELIEAKHELLTRGAYLMHQDAARLRIAPLESGAPQDLAQARNAVALARLAGADRFAAESFGKAETLLATAEEARTNKRGGNAIMMPARQAAQTAEDARLVGLKRQEEDYQAEQRRVSTAREGQALASASAARDRAAVEMKRRQAAEATTQVAASAQDAAERGQVTAERGLATAAAVLAASDAARVASERGQATAERGLATADAALAVSNAALVASDTARVASEAARAEAEAARVTSEAARREAEAGRTAAEARVSEATVAAASSEKEKADLREQLREQLNRVIETRETARGLVINLSDVLFDSGSATIKPGAREKLSRLSGILISHPELQLEVEGHTDSQGALALNQRLSERRAESVRGYLVGQRIAAASVGTAGFGEDQPVATNETAAGRQQNRRVEVVVSGDVIGRR